LSANRTRHRRTVSESTSHRRAISWLAKPCEAHNKAFACTTLRCANVVDAAIFWWREDDGDLVDALVDALTNLADGGVIWLLTPKSGRPGHVEPSEIEDAAPTAGLHATSTISACRDWTGTRLATPKGGRR